MKTYSVKREIKLKSGEVLNIGDTLEFIQCINDGRSVEVNSPKLGRQLKLGMISFATKVLGKKVPSLSTMEKWSDDGIARSVQGQKVEPDGFDGDGFPSWMLVVGII
jgi:hypothetical protein